MKVRHSSSPLPRDWSTFAKRYGILGELDIAVRHTSRLRLKALMFRTNRDLRRFWKERLNRPDLCRFTRGVVSILGCKWHKFPKNGPEQKFIEVDPRFFCIMGLIAGKVNMEIITHESVHAAFAYAKRVHHKDLWHGARNHDEEDICYPAGRIAHALNSWCHRRGYYRRHRSKPVVRSQRTTET